MIPDDVLHQIAGHARSTYPAECCGLLLADASGALRIHPDDAQRLGIADGGRARLTTKRASVETVVEVTDTLQPGYVTLPNGLGTSYPDADGSGEAVHGVPPNELTASEDRDWLAGTPHHKHVRARVEALA